MSELTLSLFGPPRLTRDGVPVDLSSRKALALLAYLAVTGTRYRHATLAALLWPESDPARAQSSLRYALSLLGRALDGAWLVVDRETIALDGREKQAVDVIRFRALLAECQTHGHSVQETCPDCLPLLGEAVELYRGDFMAGFTLLDSPEFDDWQSVEGEGLQGEVAGALERLAEARAAQGEVEKAIAPPAVPRHNLPVQPTPFVGREDELDQVAQYLADPACRLLTVVGPGGMGKSRLAIQAAEEQLSAFNDGVWFVPLAPLDSADLLSSAIMDALGTPLQGATEPNVQLLNYLRERHLLLILDNFEHLFEGASLVVEMLGSAPQLKVLVTSRERLRLRQEWALSLRGMRVPEGSAAPEEAMAALEDYSALQLFVQCARRAQSGFSLAAAGTDAVIRICQLVDGMPLAIELAAPWIRVMPCEDIVQEIEGGLDLLTTTLRDVPQRHSSMQAVFKGSWQLLSDRERAVLRQLSVFRGGFRRQAAEVVADASLRVLSSLVDRSWVRATLAGRY